MHLSRALTRISWFQLVDLWWLVLANHSSEKWPRYILVGSSDIGTSDSVSVGIGRGSGTPSLDVFITLLSLGQRGYKQLCVQRKVTPQPDVCGFRLQQICSTGELYIFEGEIK